MSKIQLTINAAEDALLELIAEGVRVSQHAIEKRAGLANGALNYKHPMYQDFKKRISEVKVNSQFDKNKPSKEHVDSLVKERALKDKYRIQRNEFKEQLKIAEGERLELQYQLYHLQKYFKHLEKHGVADSNVLEFSLLDRS